MTRSIRPLCWLLFALFLVPARPLLAEKVADLPTPTGYVNDFAGLLTPSGKQQIESLCTQVQKQTGAEISVVTIKTLDDDQTVEDFTVALEEKWKVGKRGKDNGLLILLVQNPRKLRTEVGYGLEGILPDSLVGRIQQQMVPLLHRNDYDGGLLLGVQDYANVIAKDAGVTLQQPDGGQPYPDAYYHRQRAQPHLGIGGIIGGVIIVALLILMIATGNGGWLWVLLMMLMNGGGRGGGFGGDGDGDGGGFGGFGGGSSGGGGASSDY
jgi:uncharacterized protein